MSEHRSEAEERSSREHSAPLSGADAEGGSPMSEPKASKPAQPSVSGAAAEGGGPIALLLTPGAGAGRDNSALVAIEEAVKPVPVERMDFPYRIAGRKSPDSAAVLIAAVQDGAADLARSTGVAPENIFLGGRSMGGRMCSMAVAGGLPAAGLVLVSYPLHPPGKPEKMRTEHLPRIEVPCLFVSGTRDAFATPEELEAATALIPGSVTHVWLEGGDHGLRRRDAELGAVVRDWLTTAASGLRG